MESQHTSIQIAVATHKPYAMPQSECYLPLHVGAELHPDVCNDMQQDNVGENISVKNAFYSELTGLYWMWKNSDTEFKGLVHYRRHFKGSQATEGPLGKVATTVDFLNVFANEKVDVILPVKRNYFIETIEQHYVHTMPEEQLQAAKVVVKKLNPEYMPAFEEVLDGNKAHMFNMFVMKRTCFDAYCEWLFHILF